MLNFEICPYNYSNLILKIVDNVINTWLKLKTLAMHPRHVSIHLFSVHAGTRAKASKYTVACALQSIDITKAELTGRFYGSVHSPVLCVQHFIDQVIQKLIVKLFMTQTHVHC